MPYRLVAGAAAGAATIPFGWQGIVVGAAVGAGAAWTLQLRQGPDATQDGAQRRRPQPHQPVGGPRGLGRRPCSRSSCRRWATASPPSPGSCTGVCARAAEPSTAPCGAVGRSRTGAHGTCEAMRCDDTADYGRGGRAWSTSSSWRAGCAATTCSPPCAPCRGTCSCRHDLAAEAYVDTPLPIGLGQTISQPYMVALMTELLARRRAQPRARDRRGQRLPDGRAGRGRRARSSRSSCSRRSRSAPASVLARLGYQNATAAIADGAGGGRRRRRSTPCSWPRRPPEAPPALLEQLADGGRLVIPLGRPAPRPDAHGVRARGDEFIASSATRCAASCRWSATRRQDSGRGGDDDGRGRQRRRRRRSADGWEEVAAMKAVEVRVSGSRAGRVLPRQRPHEAQRLGLRGWVRNRSDGTRRPAPAGRPGRRRRHARLVQASARRRRDVEPASRSSDAEPDDSLSGFRGEIDGRDPSTTCAATLEVAGASSTQGRREPRRAGLHRARPAARRPRRRHRPATCCCGSAIRSARPSWRRSPATCTTSATASAGSTTASPRRCHRAARARAPGHAARGVSSRSCAPSATTRRSTARP